MATIDTWRLVNEHYPGTWRATVTRLVTQGEAAVTVASVFDDTTAVTAISFFAIRDGLIEKLVEYWPDSYIAPVGGRDGPSPSAEPTQLAATPLFANRHERRRP